MHKILERNNLRNYLPRFRVSEAFVYERSYSLAEVTILDYCMKALKPKLSQTTATRKAIGKDNMVVPMCLEDSPRPVT